MRTRLKHLIAPAIITLLPLIASAQTVGVPFYGGNLTLPQYIGRTINILLGFSGVAALIMFLYGGWLYMLAGNSSAKIEKAKGTLIWAVIGLIVMFSAYSIVNFVITQIAK